MNTIVFNNEVTCGVESFNKTTTFDGNTVNSTGYASITTTDMSGLTAVAQNAITSIKILHDEDIIYNSTNLNASITSINEFLGSDKMNININLVFN